MKKLLLILLILTFSVAFAEGGAPVPDEATAWSLGGTYLWGMDEAQIAATLPQVKIEKEVEAKLTYLEPDDYDYLFEGLRGEISFGLKDGALVLIELDFGDGVKAQAVRDALAALYGEGEVTEDTAALEALSDPEEIDLKDDDPLSFEKWTLPDGTQVLMITDVKDDEADVVFYQAPIAE